MPTIEPHYGVWTLPQTIGQGFTIAVCPCRSGKKPRMVGNYFGCDDCHPWAQSARSKFHLRLNSGRIPDYVPGRE